ncbi:MAG: InlB B-repeat-containing protein, partial [Peptococcaceae bacterium]|nr:InlB B-repeat-containing protein [Peptococcaceae bacterium]
MIRRCSAILICLIVSAIVLLPGLPAGARDQVSVVLDGRFLAFDVPPANVDGRTLVPMRIIFEALEAEVYWDSESGTVTAVKDDVIIKVAIGDTHINVDGILTAMGVAPVILDGRTLVPVRFISEALGCGVRWDGDTQTVFVDSNVDLCSHDYEDDGYCKICGADFLTKGSVSTDHNGKYVGVYEDNPVLDRPYRLYSYSTTIDEGEEVTVFGSMENHLGALWYKVSPTADKWVLSTNLRKIVTHYAVIYNANGGIDTPTSQYKTEYTDLILSSTKPTRNGYSFEGWGTSVDTNTVSYKAGDVYKNNSSVKLYAIWKRQQEPDIVISAGINKTVGTV